MNGPSSIESLVREALRVGRAEGGGACLDPETLTGFAEDRLRGRERRDAIAHLALCPACSELTGICARPGRRGLRPRLGRLAAAAAAILVLAGAASGALRYAEHRGEQQLIRIAREALGPDVEIERADVRVGRRLSLSLSGVRLRPPAGGQAAEVAPSPAGPRQATPAVSVEQVRVEVPPTALWRPEERQGDLILVRPVVHLERDSTGSWNVSAPGVGARRIGGRRPDLKEKLQNARQHSPLRGVEIEDGFIEVTDHLVSPPFFIQVASVSGGVSNIHAGDTLRAEVSGITPSSPGGRFLGEIELRNLERQHPLEAVLNLSLGETPLVGTPFPPLDPLVRIDGLVEAAFSLHSTGSSSAELLGSLAGEGSLSLRDGTLKGFNLWDLVLDEIGSAAGRTPFDPADRTPLRRLEAGFAVEQSVVSVRTLHIENETLRLDATGAGDGDLLLLAGTLVASPAAYAQAASTTPGIATFATASGGAAMYIVLDLNAEGVSLTLAPL